MHPEISFALWPRADDESSLILTLKPNHTFYCSGGSMLHYSPPWHFMYFISLNHSCFNPGIIKGHSLKGYVQFHRGFFSSFFFLLVLLLTFSLQSASYRIITFITGSKCAKALHPGWVEAVLWKYFIFSINWEMCELKERKREKKVNEGNVHHRGLGSAFECVCLREFSELF